MYFEDLEQNVKYWLHVETVNILDTLGQIKDFTEINLICLFVPL